MAACSVCHSSHGTERTSGAMLTGPKPVCSRCHPAGSVRGKTISAMGKQIAGLAPDAQRKAARQFAHALKLAP
jgi:predicted CXXCH cytochrome family protein